jgi:hypothetical protein
MHLRIITKPLNGRMYNAAQDERDVTLKLLVSEKSWPSIFLTYAFANTAVAFEFIQ